MFDFSFQRLVWKEFRAQWHIWAALLVGVYLLQLPFLFRELHLPVDYPFYVGMVLTACYAVTSGAILFAGEREEQTDDWLRQLPMSARRLMAGKVTFLLASIVAFAAVAYALAFIFFQTANVGSKASHIFWGDQREQSILFFHAILGMTVWSVFYSLILNRVMAVLAATTATYLVVAGIIDNFLPEPFEAWMTGVTLVVAAIDLWLGKLWLAGPSSRPMQGARARLQGDRIATGLGSRFWLSSVRSAAQMTPLGLRTLGVLLWRELRSAVPFAVAWGLCGVLMFVLSGAAGMEGANYLWFLLTPLLCGLMTCTGDNTKQAFRFLADRGLSPLTVWITKHAVWLLVAIGLIVVFAWYDMSTVSGGFNEYELRRNAPPRAVYGFAALASVPGSLAEPHFADESKWRAISAIASLILALYFLGHVCSLWLRRVIVAMSVAGLCGVLLVAWTAASLRLDVPPLLTLWPLAIAGILASVLTVSGWLHERSSWKRIAAQAAGVVVPLLIVGSSTMAYRATQIPVVTLPFNWEAKAKEMERTSPQWERDWQQTFDDLRSLASGSRPLATNHEVNDSGADMPSDDDAADAAINIATKAAELAANRARMSGDGASGGVQTEAAAAPAEFQDMPGMMGMGGAFDTMAGMAGMMGMPMESAVSPWETLLDTTTASGALIERLVAMADRLKTQTKMQTPSLGLRTLTAPNLPIITLGQVLVAAADLHRQRGELDEALRVLQAGLTLTEYLAREVIAPDQLQSSWNARGAIQQGIQRWAADPQQTVEQLQNALATTGEFGVVRAVRMLENQYSVWRQAIEQPDSEAGRLLGGYVWPNRGGLWPPASEKERMIRLMGVITESKLQTGSANGAARTTEDMQRWDATTMNVPYFGPYPDPILNIRPTAAAEMATPLIIRLHLYRMEHGAFPETLDQLRNEANPEIPRDPATGGMFGYAPQGFEVPVLVASDGIGRESLVRAGMPLLWSPGTEQPERVADGQLVFMSSLRHLGPAQLREVTERARQNFPELGDAGAQRLQNDILFVFIGQGGW